MTPDAGTSGPGEEEVRRLLADLGERSVPMPPEVAARLDATLAELSTEREQTTLVAGPATAQTTRPTTEPTTASTTGPTRRRWPQLLVAAAAVSVLGLGVGEVLEGSSSPESMTAATAERGEDAGAGGHTQEDGPEAAEPEPYAAPAAPESLTEDPRDGVADRRTHLDHAPPALTRLRSDSLSADVQRLAHFTVDDTAAGGTPLTAGVAGSCELPAAGRGDQLYAVRLDGDPATLVLHRARDGIRVAEVFGCDDASAPVATTAVAAD